MTKFIMTNMISILETIPKEEIRKDQDFIELYNELKKIFEKEKQSHQEGSRSDSL